MNSSLDLSDSFNTSGEWTAGFTYDVMGNVLTATDAKGVTITNTYDKVGRVKTRTYSDGTPAVDFYYDGKGLSAPQNPNYAKGKLTKVTSSVSETRYELFDEMGRLTQMSQFTDGQTYTSKYTYNLSGALIEEEYPSGRKVRNEFESDGDLARIYGTATTSANERTYANSFSYMPDGRIEKLRLGNGLWEAAKFNDRLQVTEMALGHGVESGDLWRLGYEYGVIDGSGNVDETKNIGNVAKQTLNFNGLAQPFVTSYKYDSLYRLIEAQETQNSVQTWKEAFSYDRYGNRIGHDKFIGTTELTQTNLTHPAIDENTNRFTSGQGFTYDKNGNIVTDPTDSGRNFVFNGDNKQKEVRDANNNLIGEYFYDGEGKRIKKKTYNAGVLSETTVFVYSSDKLIAEYSTAAPPPNPTTQWTVTDQLGSPRILTNSLGEVVSRRDFMPFGEEISPDGTHRIAGLSYNFGDGVRQKFTGYQKDNETGLDFAEARMYQNFHGRFTAVDPLLASGKSANPQTFNRYVYVLNNPLILTDADGLQVAIATGKVYRKGRSFAIFRRKPYSGYTRVTETINTTTDINGVSHYATVTPNGWTIGDRVDKRKFAAAEPASKVLSSRKEPQHNVVSQMVNAVTAQPSFQVVDRIANPDATNIQFQAPITNSSASVGITRNFDITFSFGQGRNLGDFKNLATATNFTDLVNTKTLFGGLSIQSTAILEPEREISQASRLSFATGGSVNVGACVRFCAGMSYSPQDDGSYRKAVTWGVSATSAPSGGVDVNFAPQTWTFNPHRWFFGHTRQNSDIEN